MSRTQRRIFLLVAVLIALLAIALLGTADAHAATAQEIANNIRDILVAVAASVYIGIVVVVALKFLPGRHYVELGIFLIAAVVIGGIVLLPEQTVSTVKDIYRSVTKG